MRQKHAGCLQKICYCKKKIRVGLCEIVRVTYLNWVQKKLYHKHSDKFWVLNIRQKSFHECIFFGRRVQKFFVWTTLTVFCSSKLCLQRSLNIDDEKGVSSGSWTRTRSVFSTELVHNEKVWVHIISVAIQKNSNTYFKILSNGKGFSHSRDVLKRGYWISVINRGRKYRTKHICRTGAKKLESQNTVIQGSSDRRPVSRKFSDKNSVPVKSQWASEEPVSH